MPIARTITTSDSFSGVFLFIHSSLEKEFRQVLPDFLEFHFSETSSDHSALASAIWKAKTNGSLCVLFSSECPPDLDVYLDLSIGPKFFLNWKASSKVTWSKSNFGWTLECPIAQLLNEVKTCLQYKPQKSKLFWPWFLFCFLGILFFLWPSDLQDAKTKAFPAYLESLRTTPAFYFKNVPQDQVNRYLRRSLFQAQMEIPSDADLQKARRWAYKHLEGKAKNFAWDTLKLPLPPFLDQMPTRNWKAYDYFLGLLEDSLSYPTDYWWSGSTVLHRKHDGMDLAASVGTRILSPISGKVLVGSSPRAGRYIAVYNKEVMVLYAHCDKRFFLNKDTAFAGDALGTIGLTGNTTGPHVHMGTGFIHPQGKSQLQGVHFDLVDPVEWYWEWLTRK